MIMKSENKADCPKLLLWHIWGFMAVIAHKVGNRFAFHPLVTRLQWYCIERANGAYPKGFKWFLQSGIRKVAVNQKGECCEK
jgi:hypothetical protein|tara:strand:+ start:966 stop:1211 length:246 start_codon:yes stop_codon:yes gene_type:complete